MLPSRVARIFPRVIGKRLQRIFRRVLAAALACAIAGLPGFLLAPGADAQATGLLGGFMEISTVFFGESGRTFGPGDVITVSGAIPYIGGCIGQYFAGFPPKGRGEGRFDPFPTADFYVIKDTGQPLVAFQQLSDDSGGVNRVIGTASGAFLDEVVGIAQPAGQLAAGRFDVVMDQCLDGYYDPGIDIVLGENEQFAFEVVLPGNLPPINLHPIKQAAAQYTLVLDGHQITVQGGGSVEIPGFCKHFDGWVDNSAIDAASNLGIWTGVARRKCVDLIKHYDGIAKDPPDPNFTQFAELGPLDYHVAAANTPLERAARTLAGTMSEQAAGARALLTTLERFQGAQLAADDLYTSLQLEELNKQIALMIGPGGSLLRFYAALEAFDFALRQDAFGQTPQAQALRAYLPEVRRGIGQLMTPLSGQFLRKVTGPNQEVLVPVGLQAWTTVYLGLNPFLSGLGLPSIADVRNFHGLPPLAFNHPTAKTGGPYTAPPGTLIHFDASASSDPNGDALTYAWDLDGDGQFDDAATAKVDHSFAQAGTQAVGVKVTDPAGNTDVAYTFARAGDVNTQDVIALSNREEMWRISPSGSVTTLRPALPFVSNPTGVHVDVNGDIWVMRAPHNVVNSALELARYDSSGSLLGTITAPQVSALVGFNILHFRDFVLDGRGDIILTATENLGPGLREFIDFPQFSGFDPNLTGRMKVLRLAKDGSRASVIGDVHQPYYQLVNINGQLVSRGFANVGPTSWGALALDHQGNIVVAYVNNLVWPGLGTGIFTMDPDTGGMTEVVPDARFRDPVTGAIQQTVNPTLGGVFIPSWSSFGVSPNIEVDPRGDYIFGDFRHAGIALRLARILIPPQITNIILPGTIVPAKLVEVFPLSVVVTGGPFLIANNIAIDSAGDNLVAGTDFRVGGFPPGIFRVTPDAQLFQMAVTPAPATSGEPKVLDVVPALRNVTPKDVPPPPSLGLSNLSVNQQGCPGGLTISATLRNTGSQPITHPVTAYFWDGDPGAGGSVIGSAIVNPPLAPGASAPVSFQWVNPSASSRTVFVTAAGANNLSRSLYVCANLPAPGSDTITLAPLNATPSTGTQHTVTATLLDIFGRPLVGAPIDFQINGANSTAGTAITDASGVATFQYTGANTGADTVFASFAGATSNDASVDWQGSAPDTTPPVVTVPANITVEATGPAGAQVTFSATASDDRDGTLTPNCAPSAGSTFSLGKTTVSCTAADAAGNSAQSFFDVFVVDTTPPAIPSNPNLTLEAASPAGAVATFTNPAASDIADPAPSVVCAPASGSNFTIGKTTVTCTAADASGNSAQSFFDVFVVDTTAPTLAASPNLAVPATGANGAAVTYTAPPASDIADANPAVACVPSSGSLFAMGTTRVNCTATDASGNQATSFFDVTVQVGRPRIAGTVLAKGRDSAGNYFVDVRLTNTGTGHARNMLVTQIPLRVLAGSGVVTLNTALSPALPITVGNLDVNASTTIRFYLNVPATVTRFSITESGTLRDVLSVSMAYSAAQSVIP